MHLDVVELRQFYQGTRLGRLAKHALRRRIRDYWPNIRGMNLVGFGFATPLLGPFREEAARTLALMPAQQGVCGWPDAGPNLSALVEETRWPLPRSFADRLIVAHGLETCERPNALLEEIWRVLAPGGKAIFIVPNRSGIWARRDATPFGYGRPYSPEQLQKSLAAHDFVAERRRGALFMPPSHRGFWLNVAPGMERLGSRLDIQRLAGVTVAEVTKLVYITPRTGAREAARRPLKVLGSLAPVPKPATGRSGAAAARMPPSRSH